MTDTPALANGARAMPRLGAALAVAIVFAATLAVVQVVVYLVHAREVALDYLVGAVLSLPLSGLLGLVVGAPSALAPRATWARVASAALAALAALLSVIAFHYAAAQYALPEAAFFEQLAAPGPGEALRRPAVVHAAVAGIAVGVAVFALAPRLSGAFGGHLGRRGARAADALFVAGVLLMGWTSAALGQGQLALGATPPWLEVVSPSAQQVPGWVRPPVRVEGP